MKGEEKDVFEGLCKDLIGLNADWQILRQLFTVNGERFEVFKKTAPGFFKLLQNFVVDDAVVSLSKLTEDRAGCQTLPRLVRLLKSQVTPAFHRELVADLKELQSACDNVRKHRNERVVRKARSTGAPQLAPVPAKLPPLTRRNIEHPMELSAALLSKILGHFETAGQVFEPVVSGDANALFHFLKRGYDSSEAERAAALAAFARPRAP